ERPGQRSDVREAPVLVGRRGEAALLEPAEGLLAEALQPGRVGGAGGGEGFERAPIEVGPLRDRAHRRAAAGASSHSHPLVSSPRARSLSPDLTIRPSTSTWTKSGTM